MLFRIKTYLKFLLRSTNQHGVHSPFVYTLITKCFYDKKKKHSYASLNKVYIKKKTNISFKNAKLLNRLIPYLGYKSILISEVPSDHIQYIFNKNNSVSITNNIEEKNHYDLIYINLDTSIDIVLEHIEALLSKTHNDSVIILHAIHQSIDTELIWAKIKEYAKTRVSIDTYSLGFAFFRKEQAKEHFTIRL